MSRTSRHHHSHAGRKPRQARMHRVSEQFSGASTGVVEVAQVLTSSTATTPTLGPIYFDLACLGTGTGTGLNVVSIGFFVGPSTMDAADLDMTTDPDIGWWYTRKIYLQNNSNPAGEAWTIQGQDKPFKVATRRKMPAFSSVLWLAVRPDFTGFTAVQTNVNLIITELMD